MMTEEINHQFQRMWMTQKILRSEVPSSIEKKMKRHKAAGPDVIVTEMTTSLEEYGVSKVTDNINEL